jgi:exodeoxyribonuclease VII large subunit
VTSPRGAAVHDVLRTLRRRFPLACILLAGVPVEGANAPAALIEGLRTVERAGADEILLVRGGGSFEDLMPFNDELLARAIAASRIPVITGIGHEPDTSIADMVADMRASTPTAAAEASAPDIHELAATLDMTNDRMLSALQQSLERRNLQFQRFAERPVFKDPHSLFAADAERLEVMGKRIHQAIPAGLARDTMALSALAKRLSTKGASLVEPYDAAMRLRASRLNDLSPLSVLGRGFAMVKDEEGTILRSVDAAPAGTLVDVALSDGTLSCRVEMSEHTEMVRINWEEPSCRK